jgi:hypothetical protein
MAREALTVVVTIAGYDAPVARRVARTPPWCRWIMVATQGLWLVMATAGLGGEQRHVDGVRSPTRTAKVAMASARSPPDGGHTTALRCLSMARCALARRADVPMLATWQGRRLHNSGEVEARCSVRSPRRGAEVVGRAGGRREWRRQPGNGGNRAAASIFIVAGTRAIGGTDGDARRPCRQGAHGTHPAVPRMDAEACEARALHFHQAVAPGEQLLPRVWRGTLPATLARGRWCLG